MKKGIFLTLLIILGVCHYAYASETIKHTVYFETDHSELTDEQRRGLNELTEKIAPLENFQLSIIGHTSNTGDSLYNIRLSEKRSKIVASFLRAEGITEQFMNVSHHGWNKPIADNSTEEGRQLNRRVDVLITLPTVEEPEHEPVIMPISLLYERLQQPWQTFCIQPRGDTVLKASRGTLVSFSKDMFTCHDIPEDACITIRLIEIYNRGEMLAANLSTQAENGVLISHAMLELEAEYNGRLLDPCGDIVLAFPTTEPDEEMMWFAGERDEEGNVIWQDESEVDIIQGRRIRNLGSTRYQRCPFFFCKIKHFFRKLFNRDEDYDIDKAITQDKLAKIEERLEGHNAEELSNASRDDLDYYISRGMLGLNNIDIYFRGRENVDLIVQYKYHRDIKFKLIIGKERAWAPFYEYQNRYRTPLAPGGVDAHIMGLKYVDDVPHLALKKITIGEVTVVEDLTFKPVGFDELKDMMTNL